MKEKWYMLAKKVIYGSALIFLFFLSIVSLIYSSDGYEIRKNSVGRVLCDLAGVVLFFGIVWISSYLWEKMSIFWRIIVLSVFFLIAMSFSTWWIINSANLPQSDAKSIYDIAYRAKNHDLLSIAPTGSYMSLWPFQSGLVLLFEIIFRLLPWANEMTIQWLYLPFMALSLVAGYMVVKNIFSSSRTRFFWCMLMLFCVPYYLYVNNMYGEIPSIALMFFVLWMLLEYSKRSSRYYLLVFGGIGLAAAVAIRKNTLIFVIAGILIWIILFLQKHCARYFAIILVMMFSATAGIILPQKFYELRARNTMGDGVPAIAYIAMGLQWSEGRSPGGWNGYHSDLYMSCSYDAELTAEISAQNAMDSIQYMIGHPKYLIDFFYNKQVEQWCREDYGCLYETLEFYGERTPAAWEIYRGKWKDALMHILSSHQSLVYVGACCFCIFAAIQWRNRKRKGQSNEGRGIERLILLVTFIGGFLFSMLWEAGARYVMPYFIMLIPYAADALARGSYWLENKIHSMLCPYGNVSKPEANASNSRTLREGLYTNKNI